MKATVKTTFERYGKVVVGHIEDAKIYEGVKNGKLAWKDEMYQKITHIRIPKEVFERLIKIDKEKDYEQHTNCESICSERKSTDVG